MNDSAPANERKSFRRLPSGRLSARVSAPTVARNSFRPGDRAGRRPALQLNLSIQDRR